VENGIRFDDSDRRFCRDFHSQTPILNIQTRYDFQADPEGLINVVYSSLYQLRSIEHQMNSSRAFKPVVTEHTSMNSNSKFLFYSKSTMKRVFEIRRVRTEQVLVMKKIRGRGEFDRTRASSFCSKRKPHIYLPV
jgi:hypothetical protein